MHINDVLITYNTMIAEFRFLKRFIEWCYISSDDSFYSLQFVLIITSVLRIFKAGPSLSPNVLTRSVWVNIRNASPSISSSRNLLGMSPSSISSSNPLSWLSLPSCSSISEMKVFMYISYMDVKIYFCLNLFCKIVIFLPWSLVHPFLAMS